MSLTVRRSIDVEEAIRLALSSYLTAYCRPLPANYSLPCVLISQVGGTDESAHIDTFDIVLDSRAGNSAEANSTLRNAIAILREVASSQKTAISHVTVNSSGNWGNDPVRPDLAMYSARLQVVAHLETTEINEITNQ